MKPYLQENGWKMPSPPCDMAIYVARRTCGIGWEGGGGFDNSLPFPGYVDWDDVDSDGEDEGGSLRVRMGWRIGGGCGVSSVALGLVDRLRDV